MRDLEELTTREMTNAEWKRYIKEWITDHSEMLVIECNMSKKEAKERAEYDFDGWSGAEGYTGRDERILMKRNLGAM